jgi:glycosyltransferase involved in cell wall biosynthesis
LALTLGLENWRLLDWLERLRSGSEIRVHNLGVLLRERVLDLYKCARALIFPSTSESFGLPLVKAEACGLPIVAAELDYVWDVVTPVETFDPDSPLLITRAVRRFLGCPETPGPLMTASEFLERILRL